MGFFVYEVKTMSQTKRDKEPKYLLHEIQRSFQFTLNPLKNVAELPQHLQSLINNWTAKYNQLQCPFGDIDDYIQLYIDVTKFVIKLCQAKTLNEKRIIYQSIEDIINIDDWIKINGFFAFNFHMMKCKLLSFTSIPPPTITQDIYHLYHDNLRFITFYSGSEFYQFEMKFQNDDTTISIYNQFNTVTYGSIIRFNFVILKLSNSFSIRYGMFFLSSILSWLALR